LLRQVVEKGTQLFSQRRARRHRQRPTASPSQSSATPCSGIPVHSTRRRYAAAGEQARRGDKAFPAALFMREVSEGREAVGQAGMWRKSQRGACRRERAVPRAARSGAAAAVCSVLRAVQVRACVAGGSVNARQTLCPCLCACPPSRRAWGNVLPLFIASRHHPRTQRRATVPGGRAVGCGSAARMPAPLRVRCRPGSAARPVGGAWEVARATARCAHMWSPWGEAATRSFCRQAEVRVRRRWWGR